MGNRIWICWLVSGCFQQIFSILVEKASSGGITTWNEDTKYRDRSVIPVPTKEDVSKLSRIPYEIYTPQAGNTKKWKIGRIFYTLPIGAMFPMYFTSHRGSSRSRAKGKKSEIYASRKFIKHSLKFNDGSLQHREKIVALRQRDRWRITKDLLKDNQRITRELSRNRWDATKKSLRDHTEIAGGSLRGRLGFAKDNKEAVMV